MLISYPILGLAPSEVFADNAIEKISGTYPVTPGQAWHGGLHITFPATGGNEARAIADGTVVAYRIPTEQPKDAATLEKHPLNYCGWTDDGFVLLKHEKESGEKTKVVFFSLYMHLSELPKAIFKGSPGAVQIAKDIEVKRKQKIGKLGSAYGQGARMHLEIFTDETSLNAFFKHGKEKYKVDEKGCGDGDLWGDTHFVIPKETAYFNQEPGAELPKTSKQTDEVLCITIQYRDGNRIVTAYRENGEQIGKQTDAEYKENKGYEYNLYKLAQKRFPQNISAGYELLRHGRAYGPDPLPTGARNWQYLPLGFGRHGWIDLNQDKIKKLSDADFPYWKWKLIKEDSGVFNPNDCKCEIAELLQAIDPDQDGIAAPLEFKWLYNNKEAAERMKYLVCQFPTEWDATNAEKKWAWLKEYFKNPAVRRKELAEKHKEWIDGVKTRSENMLKTAQSDLKLAEDAKKEKQDAAGEQKKSVTELAKQESAAEAKINALEKENAKLKKKNAKPEEISKSQKQLDDARQALDEKKAEKQKVQSVLAETEQQIKEIDVSIQKIKSKIQGLEATIKAAPKALESADSEIKVAEVALKNPASNTDPEKSWKEFKAHMEALQWWDKVKPLPSSTVWHFHPLALIDHFKKCHWLSKEELAQIYPDSKGQGDDAKEYPKVREKYLVAINKVLYRYGITDSVRMSHFFGQGAVESACLQLMVEGSNAPHRAASLAEETKGFYANPKDLYGYFYNYEVEGNDKGNVERSEFKNAAGEVLAITIGRDEKGRPKVTSPSADSIDITKSKVGDGTKFRGRGMKQLTGRANYADYWVFRGWLKSGVDFDTNWWSKKNGRPAPIDDPQRISIVPFNAIDSAGWFAIKNGIPKASDGGLNQSASNSVSAIINKWDQPSFARRWTETQEVGKVLGDN